ncbi:MAG: 2-hydroxychromene-2-carboxylate isomerase [Alphaproteobacteria bacterium]
MLLRVDWFWSFRSPYCYLATGRIVALAANYDLAVSVRPVLPLAIRAPEFFRNINPLQRYYHRLDAERVASIYEIDFAWPDPDPVMVDPKTQEVSAEQPHIHRLTFLGIEAVRRDRGLAFVHEVSRIIWSGRVKGWDRGEHLARATGRAGLDLDEMDAAIAADPASYQKEAEANHAALRAAGHWGVPTMVFEGEPFFGQDRIDACVWRMQHHGLSLRSS